ncbi:hypothetical protein PNOK_0234700 [Pyrrhoderma noxium]|uniref:Uncharacterized protein n=1 Tax=Pyrrhoderma noxium TaxID=2282107 RepID=A0A286US11_9AGAM|nr:hypothetical protein PNOK_0234700 [Pyrrhoderma noxium]
MNNNVIDKPWLSPKPSSQLSQDTPLFPLVDCEAFDVAFTAPLELNLIRKQVMNYRKLGPLLFSMKKQYIKITK